jgi:hypothetical protein
MGTYVSDFQDHLVSCVSLPKTSSKDLSNLMALHFEAHKKKLPQQLCLKLLRLRRTILNIWLMPKLSELEMLIENRAITTFLNHLDKFLGFVQKPSNVTQDQEFSLS